MPRRAADECEQWAQILALPNPSDRKRFFQILVITSWAVLGVTGWVLCLPASQPASRPVSWPGYLHTLPVHTWAPSRRPHACMLMAAYACACLWLPVLQAGAVHVLQRLPRL
jgi:hypothetical protein